jgi:hypothetical protein
MGTHEPHIASLHLANVPWHLIYYGITLIRLHMNPEIKVHASFKKVFI